MFLLAAALAAFADGATAREARAATHELARRLGPPAEVDLEVPPVGEMILRLVRAVLDHPDAPLSWGPFSSKLTRVFRVLYPVDRDDIPYFRATMLSNIPMLEEEYPTSVLQGRSVLYLDTSYPYRTRAAGPPERDALLLAYVRAVEAAARGSTVDEDAANAFETDLPSLLDWVEATHPPLRRLTLPRIRALSEAWHGQFKAVGFGGAVPDAWVVLRWPNGWTLQRLTEKKELALEGESMAHCVGGPVRPNGRRDGESAYWQAVRAGTDVIFSFRSPTGVPVATLQGTTGNRRILQVQGPEDQVPDPKVQYYLREALWALRVFRTGVGGGQAEVHNLGGSGVWTDEDAHQSPIIEKAIEYLKAANQELAKVRAGNDSRRPFVSMNVATALKLIASYMKHALGVPNHHLHVTPEDEVWLLPNGDPRPDPNGGISWESNEGLRTFAMFGVGSSFRFHAGFFREEASTESFLDALRLFFGIVDTPPDVSFLARPVPLPLVWSGDMEAVRAARAAATGAPRLGGPGPG